MNDCTSNYDCVDWLGTCHSNDFCIIPQKHDL
jgi:hypothetical protein